VIGWIFWRKKKKVLTMYCFKCVWSVKPCLGLFEFWTEFYGLVVFSWFWIFNFPLIFFFLPNIPHGIAYLEIRMFVVEKCLVGSVSLGDLVVKRSGTPWFFMFSRHVMLLTCSSHLIVNCWRRKKRISKATNCEGRLQCWSLECHSGS
jgi:hypothetical protein